MADFLEDPGNLGLLSLGLRLMSTPGKFGSALGTSGLGAIGDMQQAKAAQQAARTRALQEQQMQMQLEELKRAQAEKQKQQAAMEQFRSQLQPPTGAAVAWAPAMNAAQADAAMGTDGYGPASSTAKAGKPDQLQSIMYQAAQLGLINPLDYVKMTQKDTTPIKLGKDETLLEPGTFKPLFSNVAAEKPEPTPASIKEYQFAVGQGFKGTYDQWDLSRKRAGASSVSVNTGQKGFDNTLKLRGDFRSEPIYKAHQEVQSAYAQIKAGLQQESPAGDLAGATKLMKLLDPGSVVRESELGMAMAASGLLDRAQYYATNVLNGTKLTPTQRKDFKALADKLFAESSAQYSAKRSEYENIASRNGLGVEDVVGPASSNSGWSIKPAN